jgi:hypothetical protein
MKPMYVSSWAENILGNLFMHITHKNLAQCHRERIIYHISSNLFPLSGLGVIHSFIIHKIKILYFCLQPELHMKLLLDFYQNNYGFRSRKSPNLLCTFLIFHSTRTQTHSLSSSRELIVVTTHMLTQKIHLLLS